MPAGGMHAGGAAVTACGSSWSENCPACYMVATVSLSSSSETVAGDVAAIVDVERYPLDDLESPAGRVLVDRCRAELVEVGACELPGFLRPEAVRRAVAEALELKPLAHRSVVIHTIDLTPAEAASDGEDPLVAGYRTAKASLAYDQIPTGSVLRGHLRVGPCDPLHRERTRGRPDLPHG